MQNGLFKNDVKADEGKEFISEQNEREWVEFFKSCRMYFAYKIRQKRGYEGGLFNRPSGDWGKVVFGRKRDSFRRLRMAIKNTFIGLIFS